VSCQSLQLAFDAVKTERGATTELACWGMNAEQLTDGIYNSLMAFMPYVSESSLNFKATYNTIQEIQVVAPPKWQVYTGASCGSQGYLSLNMHSQQSMNYTHRAARGDVASAAIPVRISATAAQRRTWQHTAADRVRAHGGRSLIGERTLHLVGPGHRGARPSQAHQQEDGTWEAVRRSSPHYRSGRREGARWRGRAARVAQARSSGWR